MHLEFTKSELDEIIDKALFTDFELKVLPYLIRGWYYVDIAEELHCCKATVDRAVKRIKSKIMKCV